MPKLSKKEENKVVIYYWTSSLKEGGVGHVALQTFRGGKLQQSGKYKGGETVGGGYYMSFYPKTNSGRFFDTTRDGDHHTYLLDVADHRSAPKPNKVTLYTLDVDAINDAYEEFLTSGLKWDLYAKSGAKNCSGLVGLLLDKGGIKNLFSLWDKIKTGLLTGAVVGAVAGGVIVTGTTIVPPPTDVSSFLPVIGFTLVIFGGAVCGLPGALAAKFIAASMLKKIAISSLSGAVLGGGVGAGCEYVYTEYRLGKALLTPGDIYKLAIFAELVEKKMGSVMVQISAPLLLTDEINTAVQHNNNFSGVRFHN